MPFDINVKTDPGKFENKMTHLQCDTELTNTFQHI